MSRDGYEEAEYVAKSHVCPDCGDKARLVVRWDVVAKRNSVWCGGCHRTEGFRRRESLTAIWRRNPEAVPTSIADSLERKYGVEPMNENSLVVATEQTMVERIEGARWLKALSPDDRRSLAHLSVQYGFDPLMKELIIYEGQPYITVQGLIRMAHRQKMFAGVEDRPMTEAECKQYGYTAPLCWIAKVYRKDWRVPAVGTGHADPHNPFRKNPIEVEHPEWMARSRALRQALKLAFPHFLPFEQMEAAEERGIDPETGEILDGQAVLVEEAPEVVGDQPVASPAEAATSTQSTVMPAGSVANAPTLVACSDCHGNIYPGKDAGGVMRSPSVVAMQTQRKWGVPLCLNCHELRKIEEARQAAASADAGPQPGDITHDGLRVV